MLNELLRPFRHLRGGAAKSVYSTTVRERQKGMGWLEPLLLVLLLLVKWFHNIATWREFSGW